MEVNIESLFPSIRQGGLATGEEDLINSTYVGIDFGTSTTVVSVAHFDVESKKIITEPLWLNQKLEDGTILSNEKVPTVIAWRNQNLLIGTGAANLKFELKKGKNVWYSFKMELGEDHGAMYYQSELDGNNGAYKIINPIDAAKIFFQYLNAQIKRHVSEKGLSTNIKYAVSIPASFEANQRRELIEALEHNGMRLNSQSLIDEPNAAFLSYVQNASEEGNSIYIPEDHYPNLLVFDFGAGTCDISILELGNNLNGVYSKNLSISRFEKLGGDDIDRLIAIELLFPALLNENNLTAEDFLTPEKRRIIQRLLKPAEELKIEICQDIALKMHERILPETASSEEFVSLGGVITIDTNKHGKITLTKPKISYAQFHEVMKHFLRTDYINPYRTEIVEGEFSSVFSPIETALNKAGIDRDDIDYVLFIGGSSKNPYVQAALKNYFSESELLIPRDLQTHVSEGAAIHSLVFNGFNKNIIQPITSEPILVVTSDIRNKVILSAGTEVPCDLNIIDDLVTTSENQKTIQLPICLGNENRILYIITINSDDPKGFPLNTRVKIEAEITTDKLLIIRATVEGKEVMIEPINPFANKELDTKQRIIFQAEKEANINARQNNGKPTSHALQKLSKAYEQAGNELRAAETLELCNELYPSIYNYNNIAVQYSNAGNRKKALEYYRLAYENHKSSTVIMNYALEVQFSDRELYLRLLDEALELDPEKTTALIAKAEEMKRNNDPVWKTHMQKAFDLLNNEYKLNMLNHTGHGWLAKTARLLGMNEFANEVMNSIKDKNSLKLYDEENLTKTDNSKKLN